MKGPIVFLAAAALLGGCEREARRLETPAQNETPSAGASRATSIQPAVPRLDKVKDAASNRSPYEGNAFAVNQGKRLYRWYNCNGCHGMGGGGIGPALMDAKWKYGGEPADIYRTITQGRPGGMPSFGGHIPDDQVWQIVAFVRSMSGQLRKDVAPSRGDTVYPGNPENARPELGPLPAASAAPPPASGASR